MLLLPLWLPAVGWAAADDEVADGPRSSPIKPPLAEVDEEVAEGESLWLVAV